MRRLSRKPQARHPRRAIGFVKYVALFVAVVAVALLAAPGRTEHSN